MPEANAHLLLFQLSRTVMQGTDAVNVEKAKSATFEQAQKMGMHIGKRMSERLQRGDAASDEEEKALQALLSHSDGARGFYVTTLTAPDIQNVFSTPIDAGEALSDSQVLKEALTRSRYSIDKGYHGVSGP